MFTKEQVEAASKGATSIRQVAKALGIIEAKTSGRTGKILRTACPNLDEILMANRESGKASTESVAKQDDNPTSPASIEASCTSNPYREGSAYHTIFAEGAKKHWVKDELIAHVAKLTKGSQRTIGFSLAVLMNSKQQSNGGRSASIRDDQGRIKLVAIPPKAKKVA